MGNDQTTYLLADGENIDATLGMSVLNRRPHPDERPRWDRILDFADHRFGRDVRALFFLNATSGQLPISFVQALIAMEYRPVPLAGSGIEKVVDVGIQRTLEALVDRGPSHVLLASHDGDFIPQVEALLDNGSRVGVLCFREFLNAKLAALDEKGLEIFDLETDVKAFQVALPRVKIIPLSEFRPEEFL
ncbi:nuclease [Bowdeniella nasicola]|uniref:Nuclease n=1 Tax=Bowdeniella nasicola TaxID=208480 RepID=A0A1Q5Q4W4_9ACTO|nr:NYN domain-containing protein [Bowdeniella nasicola]OKL54742.1 nuclease [Bowdeniella nasicola]